MDKHLKIALVVCVSAIIVAWIMRPHRFSLFGIDTKVFLLDSKNGDVWRCSVLSRSPFESVGKADESAPPKKTTDAGVLFDSLNEGK